MTAIRFLFDESVHGAVRRGCRRRGGLEVRSVEELGRAGLSDESQLRGAHRHGYLLVTSDTDFLRLGAATTDHSGVIMIHQTEIDIGGTIRRLADISTTESLEDFAGRVHYL